MSYLSYEDILENMVELPVAQLMPEYGQYLLPVAACLLLLLLFLLLFLLLCFLLLLLYQILFRLQLLPFLLLQQGVKQDNTFELNIKHICTLPSICYC